MPDVDLALSIALGIGLAATAGFRVFVPLLVLALASRFGFINIGEEFPWLSSAPAIIMLSVATVIEVLAYYVPGLDHLLDTIAAPAAVIAGVGVSAAVMTDLPPIVKWTLAIVAGGGAAAFTQSSSVLVRSHSGAFAAGMGNPVIATAELMGAIVMLLISLAAPLVSNAGVSCRPPNGRTAANSSQHH